MEDGENISITFDYDRSVNYAMQQNDVPVIKALQVVNSTQTQLRDLQVRINAEPVFALPWEGRIASINPGETFNFGIIDLPLGHDYLGRLTERVVGSLHAEVLQEGVSVARLSQSINVLAYDEWNGLQSIPEILAAFVTPNHPAVESVLSAAAGILGKWTGDSSISGYQSRDSRRVTLTVAAIYSALQQLNISYINPPASFEETGQKIRLPDRIMESRLATCLDLSVFAASCLEQAGLYPLIIITTGHAFVGVWLEDETFADAANDDLLRLRKRVELGQISVFETTLLTSAQAVSFEQAVNHGLGHLQNEAAFRCLLDIRRARKSRIRPLPLRVESTTPTTATEEKQEEATAPSTLNIPKNVPEHHEGPAVETETPATRLDRWKRKLLDLTLHNRLLNFRESKKNLSILCPDLGALEDALADGMSFKIYPRLGDLGEKDGRVAEVHKRRTGQESLNEMLREEFHARRLHADVTETEVGRRLLEIYREARLSIEENGANTLYLALGFLAWYEDKAAAQRRLAPIILIPLEIERRSLQEGFTIKQGDDEPMVNITLLTHLAADFDLKISGLDPIPVDDHGLNVPLILRKFREAIVDIDRWEVLENAFIGHFSFAKFLMWRDLDMRAEELERNAVVRHLIRTPTEKYPGDDCFPDPDRLDETHTPESTFCPLSADSSQLAAVYAAADGKSFVLHGPPGTGKSQTISNIIAHALSVGKTVLFVSEKRAALEVVHRRLTESGLGPFCLELHSNKSHKKEVLSQLEKALSTYGNHSSEEWLHEAHRLAETRKNLNAFVTSLHSVRESGESVFHGISQLIGHRDIPSVRLEWPSVSQIDRQKLADLREAVRRLQVAAAEIGHPSVNPWRPAACEIWTPELRNNIEELLKQTKATTEALSKSAFSISAIVGLESEDLSRSDMANLAAISDALINCPALPTELLTNSTWDEIRKFLRETIVRGRKRDDLQKKLHSRFNNGILTMDLDALSQQWFIAEKAWILPRWIGFRKVRKTLGSVASKGHVPQNSEIVADISLAQAVRKEQTFLKQASEQAKKLLGNYWHDAEANWDEVESIIERTDMLRKVASQVAGVNIDLAVKLRQNWAKLLAGGAEALSSAGQIGQRLHVYREAFDQFKKVQEVLASLLLLDQVAAWGPADSTGLVPRLLERAALWLQSLSGLRAWCHWRAMRRDAVSLNLQPLVEAYERGTLPAEKLLKMFARGYYQWWCDTIIGTEPALSGFVSSDFEDKISQFREIDDRYIYLTREEIRARVAAKLPQGQGENPNSEMGLLRRQIQRQRAHMPVRALLQKIPNLLPRIKPCLLMSPISVAQYLDPAYPPFDLAVFDEASQIPVWDAVGAIARGKEAIIVGDPKQLPPTNFFSRVEGDEVTDIDDSLVEDLESILDDCIAARLPERHLNWHYRSRHESLIAFSNYHYYGNRLLTFPSPHQELGVSFRHIKGQYDKGKSRTNRAEAEAVVSEILRRLGDPNLSNFSVGVVTFSLPQQLLIDDLLEEARRRNPEIEPYFSDSTHEPVFIKNLENVQGDERDVILFSICYGPDAAGRVSMNFGPLNRDGGERRLNVAITRARREVIVFSTLRAEHVDLSRTRARGVADLKCFLDYAERGSAAIAERQTTNPEEECESPFENQVCDALREKGYIVHPQVGCSGYRIDLAVVDQERPGRYILGIECDGANYHRSKTARDRDKLRENILNGLGWKLHRIWSTDWWERPVETLARLVVAIEAALNSTSNKEPVAQPPQRIASAPLQISKVVDSPAAQDRTAKAQPSRFIAPIYEPFSVNSIKGSPEDFYNPRSAAKVTSIIQDIVSKEGPISLELAARRAAEHWGVTRVTARVVKHIERLSKKASVYAAQEEAGTFLWSPSQNPGTFSIFRIPGTNESSRRDADELPPQEVANAAMHVLEQNVSLPVNDLVRETARLFRFQRTGQNVDKFFRIGINMLLKDGKARDDNGMIIYNK